MLSRLPLPPQSAVPSQGFLCLWDLVPVFPLWRSPLSTSSCLYCVLSRTPDFPLFYFRSQDYTEVASRETLLPPYFSSSLLVSVNQVFLE